MIRRMQGAPAAAVAAGFGVTLRTARKWMSRFRQGGPEALADRSSRPEYCRSKLTEHDLGCIFALRKKRLTGDEIALRLGLCRSTVFRALRKLGCSQLTCLEEKQLYSVTNGNSRDRCFIRTLKSSAKLMGLDIEKQELDKFIAAGLVGNICMSA